MKPPLFWYNPPRNLSIWQVLLSPLSLIWRGLAALRWARGGHEHLPVPVICVGNINLGGAGKTPTVIKIVMLLAEMGKSAHIVSRGYGGLQKGPLAVDLKTHTADDVGDEPLLLAAFAPCWVARDRAAGARAAMGAGADVIVLDDGMQNPALAKDLTILVVDAGVGFGNGAVFPAGPLRQSVQQGMTRADIILSIGPRNAQSSFSKLWMDKISIPHVAGHLAPLKTGMDWRGLRSFAFAGIGRPAKFFDTLAGLGADIVATRSFADHQKLPLTLLNRMEKEAKALNAQLVTTEKDAVRLPASFQQKVLALPVRLELDAENTLTSHLEQLFSG